MRVRTTMFEKYGTMLRECVIEGTEKVEVHGMHQHEWKVVSDPISRRGSIN
jgi:hypothetical protein